MTERGNGFLCFEHNAAAFARTVIPYGKTRFNTRRRFCRIGRGQMSERLRSDFFISVFAVVGAHHRNLARLGTCRLRSPVLSVIMSRGGNHLVGGAVFTVLTFPVTKTRFGACRCKRNNIIAERMILFGTYNNGIIAAGVCIFVDVCAAISVNRAFTADISDGGNKFHLVIACIIAVVERT